jgi:cell division cycle 20, cofactor of APC complex
MSYNPKTPSRPGRHRSRSEAKTPLTPSVNSGLNVFCLNTSPTKGRADFTNPFVALGKQVSSSRPASPIKRTTSGAIEVSERLKRQASTGVIRKGGVESRLDVVTRDYVPPLKKEVKRSKSQPAVSWFILNAGRIFLTYEYREIPAIASSPLAIQPWTRSQPHWI